MLTIEKSKLIFSLTRCVQCGACLAACEKGALRAELGKDGLYTISVDKTKCNMCCSCVRVCPARVLPHQGCSLDLWGECLEVRLGSAKESATRKCASSGGVARTILSIALRERLFEIIYSLRQKKSYPWAEGHFWSEGDNFRDVPASLYLPILMLENLQCSKKAKSALVIGTTCQLLAAERLLKGKVEQLVKVGIFCKQQKTLALTRFLAKRLGVDEEIESCMVSYRGGTWPGEVCIGGRCLSYEKAAALPYGKRLWRVPGCLFCPNPFGGGSDLTLSDPWSIRRRGDMGSTIVCVWTRKGQQLFNACEELLYIEDLALDSAKNAVGWEAIKAQQALVEYRIGKKFTLQMACVDWLENSQALFYEKILESISLPEVAYRVVARLPDLARILQRGCK